MESHHINGLAYWFISLKTNVFEVTHIVACTDRSFLFIAVKYYIVWLYHTLFMRSPVDGHSRCFHFGAIMKNAVVEDHI